MFSKLLLHSMSGCINLPSQINQKSKLSEFEGFKNLTTSLFCYDFERKAIAKCNNYTDNHATFLHVD